VKLTTERKTVSNFTKSLFINELRNSYCAMFLHFLSNEPNKILPFLLRKDLK
jgi:hypothetical protein